MVQLFWGLLITSPHYIHRYFMICPFDFIYADSRRSQVVEKLGVGPEAANQHRQTMWNMHVKNGPDRQIYCVFFPTVLFACDVTRLLCVLRFFAAKIRGWFMVEWQDRTDQQSYNGPEIRLCDPKLQDLDKVATSLAKWRAMTTTTSLCQDSHGVVMTCFFCLWWSIVNHSSPHFTNPICSRYGIFTYLWLKLTIL